MADENMNVKKTTVSQQAEEAFIRLTADELLDRLCRARELARTLKYSSELLGCCDMLIGATEARIRGRK